VSASDPAPSQPSLGDQAIESAKWVSFSRLICEAGSFLSAIAIARLLTPTEVGHAAIAIIVLALANGVVAGSFGSPLIKQDELTNAHAEVALAMSLITGVVLAALGCLVALVVARGLGSDYGSMIALAAPAFIFASIFAVPQALRTRRFAFKALMVIEVVSTLTGSACGVLLAALGFGSAAMVLGGVVAAAVAALLSPIGVGWIRPRWHADIAREILRFGLPTSVSGLFFIGVRNIDYALITTRLTAAEVGLYFRAYTLAVDYQSKISTILVRVLFPVLSRATDPALFRAARSRMIRAHTVVLFPLLAMLAITAPALVPLVYGDQWTDAVVPTQILIVAGFTAAIGTGIGPMMLAAGKPRALLVNNVVSLLLFAVAVYVLAGYGLIATCIGVGTYRIAALVIGQYFLGTRQLGIPLRETLFGDPAPAAVCTVALVATALPVSRLLGSEPALIEIAATAAAGFAAYALVLRTVFSAAWSDLARLAQRMFPQGLRGARPTPA
jgi:O-antigen/teichoic acid export membrane protein